jgi:hypothetical protein
MVIYEMLFDLDDYFVDHSASKTEFQSNTDFYTDSSGNSE